MMQNHYVISSKYHFWTRDVPNSTKSPDLVMSGPVQEDPYGPHMGPYGFIRAHKGPYGPPYGGWIPIRFLFSAGFGSYFRVSVLIYRVSVLIFSGFGFYFVRFRFLFNCGIIRVSVLIFSGFSSYLGGVFVSFGSYFTRFGSYLARVRLGLGWGWARLG